MTRCRWFSVEIFCLRLLCRPLEIPWLVVLCLVTLVR